MPTLAKEKELGSIQIALGDGAEGTSKEGVLFEYVKVADVIDGTYKLLYDIEGIDLNSIKHAEELDYAAQVISASVLADHNVRTDATGRANISNLEIGVYLLRVTDQESYDNISPTLVPVPMWNEEAGNMDYNIMVIPKHSPELPQEGQNMNSPKTGDEQGVFPYILMAGISVSSILLAICSVKKSKSDCERGN